MTIFIPDHHWFTDVYPDFSKGVLPDVVSSSLFPILFSLFFLSSFLFDTNYSLQSAAKYS